MGEWHNLTKIEQEVYDLFFNLNMTAPQIAERRQTTRQAVYKILKNIKIKYGSDYKNHKGLQKNTLVSLWRTESLSFIVNFYHSYPRYFRYMEERGNYSIPHKRWRIFLYENLVRIQSKENVFFRAKTRLSALRQAEKDFNRFLIYASNRYGFEYEKEGRISIKCTGYELEKENSKIAKDYKKETGESFLQVYGKDGKVWFFIDDSKSLEHGYKGKNAFSNSERVENYLNDFLYNQPLTNSQLASRLNDLIISAENNREDINKITTSLNKIIKILEMRG